MDLVNIKIVEFRKVVVYEGYEERRGRLFVFCFKGSNIYCLLFDLEMYMERKDKINFMEDEIFFYIIFLFMISFF